MSTELPTGWVFDEDENAPQTAQEALRDLEPWTLLTTSEQWENYSSEDLYDFEKRLRSFLDYMSKHSKYKNTTKNRRFTFKMIYERLYGELPPKGSRQQSMRKICAYYSTRILKDTNIDGRRKKRVYVLSIKRRNQRPWCIRLRIEWYLEQGVPLEIGKLRMIDKGLQVGHARNHRVEANMEKRRERAKAAYREWYRSRYNTPEYNSGKLRYRSQNSGDS